MENRVNSSFPEEPCRWCGGTSLDIWPRKNGKFQCGCYDCYAMGPAHETRDKAIAAWNARAGAPAIDAGEVERLVDAVITSAQEYTTFQDESLAETYRLNRAALLAYVSKGVDVGKLVEALDIAREYVVERLEYEKKNCRQADSELTGKYLSQIDAAVTAAKGGR